MKKEKILEIQSIINNFWRFFFGGGEGSSELQDPLSYWPLQHRCIATVILK